MTTAGFLPPLALPWPLAQAVSAALPPPGTPLAVAVSGGADSVALLWALKVLGTHPLAVIHVDHQLRAQSPEDAAWVQALAQRLQLPCFTQRVVLQGQGGVEARARRARYQAFAELCAQAGCAHLVAAQHADDQAETLLMHILRGCGPRGLCGMPARRRLGPGLTLLRPLLSVTREQLRHWLRVCGQDWREDASNQDLRLRRNYLRHRVLPQWEAAVPGITQSLADFAHAQSVAHAELRARERAAWQQRWDGRRLLLQTAQTDPALRQALCRRILVQHAVALSRAQMRRVEQLWTAPVGTRLHVGRLALVREREALAFEQDLPTTPYTLEQETLPLDAALFAARRAGGPWQALLQAQALHGALRLRVAQKADRFHPLGAPGSRSLARILMDRGIPARRRRQWPVVVDDQGIVWVPGVTIAERARVHADSGVVLRARCHALPRLTREGASAPMHHDACAVILAAGKGTRMGSDKAKVLHTIGGKALLAHVMETCQAVGLGQVVVVVGHQRAEVEALIAPYGCISAFQDRQLGTGHAVLCAESAAQGQTVVVLCGDAPLVPAALLEAVLARRAAGADAVAVAARMPDPTGYGRMVTDAQGRLTGIVEHKDASAEIRAIHLVNSGIYAVDRSLLFQALRQVKPNNAQGEYYLTDVIRLLVQDGKRVDLVTWEDPDAILGVNTPADLARAESLLAAR